MGKRGKRVALNLLLHMLLFICTLSLVMCGGGTEPTTVAPVTVAPTTVSTPTSTIAPTDAPPTALSSTVMTQDSPITVSAISTLAAPLTTTSSISTTSTTSNITATHTSTKRRMIFVTHDLHPFFAPTVAGMSDACAAVGWECSLSGPPSYTVPGTALWLQNAIATQPDALAISFSSDTDYNNLAQEALDKGMAVVGYNTDNAWRAQKGLGYVGQEPYNAGYQNGLQAVKYAKAITGKESGKIVVVLCCSGHTALAERLRGTTDAIRKNSQYIVEPLTIENNSENNSENNAKDYIASVEAKWQAESEQIVAFVGVDAYTENLGRFGLLNGLMGKVALGGFDLLPNTLKDIYSGVMQWTIGQDPYAQGFIPVMMAWEQLERGYSGRNYETGTELIDSSNISATLQREEKWAELIDQLGLDALANETKTHYAAPPQLGTPRKMAFITHDLHPFFIPTIAGMRDACSFFRWTCTFTGPPAFNVDGTIKLLRSAIAHNPGVLAMNFSNPTAYNVLIGKALAQNILVLGYNTDNTYRSEQQLGYVGQDSYNAGYQNGLQAIKHARASTGKDKGKIVVVTCCPGHLSLEQRVRGTLDAIQENSLYEGEMLDGSENGDKYLANVTAKWLAESDQIVAFAGVDGYTENLGRFGMVNPVQGKVALGGFDLLPTTLENIQGGTMQWTIGQDPYTQGFMPVLMAWKALEYGYPPVSYDTGAEIIDASNIAAIQVREQKWLDEKAKLGQ